MLMEPASLTNAQSSSYDLDGRLDTVAEMLKGYDGSPVSKSLIRRAVLRSILHLPPNHDANEALELFYEALDLSAISDSGRKIRNKATTASNLLKIWVEARKAIATVTSKLVKSSQGGAKR